MLSWVSHINRVPISETYARIATKPLRFGFTARG